MQDRKSPIRELPLRAPGQGLQERQIDIVFDQLLFPVTAAIFLAGIWAIDLWRSYHPSPPMPWVTGSMAAIGIAYALWTLRRAWPQLRNLRLALAGERSVGQGLEELRSAGYAVYHDIPGDGFNIDHVLVGPAGVFTIETKTISMPKRGRPTILVDKDTVLVNGFAPSRDPIAQARAQSKWLATLLLKGTTRNFSVLPVVVFPGWWIEHKSKPLQAWVLNDKALPKFLAREPTRLSAEQIGLAKLALETHVRGRGLSAQD